MGRPYVKVTDLGNENDDDDHDEDSDEGDEKRRLGLVRKRRQGLVRTHWRLTPVAT